MDDQTLTQKIATLRTTFLSGRTRPVSWRRAQLHALKRLIAEHYADFEAALYADLHKSPFESFATEMGFVTDEIDQALAHLTQWMASPGRPTPVFLQPATSRVVFEPLGVVLIIGAWNFPIHLTLAPLVGAIAAGNAAVIKPPRTATATFNALARHFPEYLDPAAFLVIDDDTPNPLLLERHWDKIFFTGSGPVGKIVMQSAAHFLTPVTLELGGKSPVLIDATANLAVAAHRIAQGKFFNAGQICVSPDYILAEETILEPLIAALSSAIREFYGDDPCASPEYARIINHKIFDTLAGYLNDGEIAYGGRVDRPERYIAPTILKNVLPDAPVMQAEIFGPILPLLAVKNMDEAIAFVNGRDKPLAFYIFSENKAAVQAILDRTTSGGVCINETNNHLAVSDLPFGGVGMSGMGKYHGEWGFRDFSNARAVLDHETSFDPAVRYPPYDPVKLVKMKRLMALRVPELFAPALRFILRHWGYFILKFL